MISIQLPFSQRKQTQDFQFIVASFLFLTILAFFHGIRSSVQYSSEGIPVYWFHLSYHYLASGWTWILLLPILIGLRKYLRSNLRYVAMMALLAAPIAVGHRFSALFFDTAFRWAMGYTNLHPTDIWPKLQDQITTGIFDSFLIYLVIVSALYIFYPKRSSETLKNKIQNGLAQEKSSREMTQARPDRLVAKKNGRLVFVAVKDVTSFKSEGNYLKIFNGKAWVIIRETTKNIEAKLDPNTFFRVNRSTIVNVNFIKDLEPYFNGEYAITMQDGSIIRTGKSFRENLNRLLST